MISKPDYDGLVTVNQSAWVPIHQAVRRLTAKSREVSKSRYSVL